jgi:hypothetical protein
MENEGKRNKLLLFVMSNQISYCVIYYDGEYYRRGVEVRRRGIKDSVWNIVSVFALASACT